MDGKYKIGDVAKILGISTDLLRYYEKKGVVCPQKDKNNDYRYYDAWDINFLIDCLWYKNFGFGIEQIGKMVTINSYDDIIDLFTAKEAEYEETISRTELLLGRAREYKKSIANARQYLWRCDIRESPEIIRYMNRYNSIYDNSPQFHSLSSKWLEFIPFTKRCFEMDLDGLADTDTEDYSWGFSLSMKYARQFNIDIVPPVVHLPSERSIHSVFTSSGKGNYSPKLLKYMLDFAEENNLDITGSARGDLLCSAENDGKLTGFFEVWIPIN